MPLDPGTPSRLFPDGFGSPGDIIVSMSDSSVSFIFAVTKMVGGVKFRSSDVGFSSCFQQPTEEENCPVRFGCRWSDLEGDRRVTHALQNYCGCMEHELQTLGGPITYKLNYQCMFQLLKKHFFIS